MNKKVLIIATLVFALIFIVLLAILMGTITGKTNEANTKLVDTLDMTEGLELSNYDGATLKGNSVINCINNGKSLGGKNKLFMFVSTKAGTSSTSRQGAVYGYGEIQDSGSTFGTIYKSTTADEWKPNTAKTGVKTASNYIVYSAPESIEPTYINESAEFSSVLLKNDNNVTIGIYFEQK